MTVSACSCHRVSLTFVELSRDTVDSLKKKVETRQKKIESTKSASKAGWEVEVDKLVAGEPSI
jgi:hypothetical protein